MGKFLGDRNFYRKVYTIAIPIILQQFITAIVQLIDNIMVGNLGEVAISSVATANQVFFVVNLVIIGIVTGAGIFSAQYFGAKDFDKLKQTFRIKIVSATILAIVSIIIISIFKKPIVGIFFEQGSETFLSSIKYLNIAIFTILPFGISISTGFTFREIAKPVIPMVTSIIAILTNTILNYILIFGNFGAPALGVEGAAIATVIARIVEVTVLSIMVRKHGQVFSSKITELLHIKLDVIKNIIRKALPLTLNESLWALGVTFQFKAYALRGAEALAGYQISYTVFQLAFVLFGGLSGAINVMVGNSLGANKLEEARDNAFKLIVFSIKVAAFLSIVIFFSRDLIISLYDISEYTRKVANYNMLTLAVFFPTFVISVGCFFTLRAGGDVKSTLIMDALFMWLVPVPLSLILGYFTKLEIYEMFLILQSTELIKMVLAMHRYRKGKWVKNLAEELIIKTTSQ